MEPEGFEPSTSRRSVGFCVSNYQEPERGTLLPRAAAPSQWRRRESNPHLLVASEALCHQSFIPRLMRTDGLESRYAQR